MKEKQTQPKDQTVIVRVSKAAVRSIDALANLMNVNRSEAIRRLIPDLSQRKENEQCSQCVT